MNKKDKELRRIENRISRLTQDTKEMKEIVAERNNQLDLLITKVKGMLK